MDDTLSSGFVHAAREWRRPRRLRRLAEKPTLEDVLARIEQRRGGEVGFLQAVDDIAEERSRR